MQHCLQETNLIILKEHQLVTDRQTHRQRAVLTQHYRVTRLHTSQPDAMSPHCAAKVSLMPRWPSTVCHSPMSAIRQVGPEFPQADYSHTNNQPTEPITANVRESKQIEEPCKNDNIIALMFQLCLGNRNQTWCKILNFEDLSPMRLLT